MLSVRWWRGVTPGSYSTTRNTEPFWMVAPIARALIFAVFCEMDRHLSGRPDELPRHMRSAARSTSRQCPRLVHDRLSFSKKLAHHLGAIKDVNCHDHLTSAAA